MRKKKVEEIARKLKPPRCPKCGAILLYLNYTAQETVFARYYPPEYTGWATSGSDSEEYSCPECSAVLFEDEESAEEFFLGKRESEE